MAPRGQEEETIGTFGAVRGGGVYSEWRSFFENEHYLRLHLVPLVVVGWESTKLMGHFTLWFLFGYSEEKYVCLWRMSKSISEYHKTIQNIKSNLYF